MAWDSSKLWWGAAVSALVIVPSACSGGGRTGSSLRTPSSAPSTSSPGASGSTSADPTTTSLGAVSLTPASTSTVPEAAAFSWMAHQAQQLAGGSGDELSCPSVKFCAAVAVVAGSREPGLAIFDGTSWGPATAEAAFGGADVDVSCANPTSCVAVSGNGSYTTWNGSSWSSAAPLPLGKAPGASAISCTDPAFCMVVRGQVSGTGSGTSLYSTWAGQGWSPAHAITGIDLSSVSCLTATFCRAVGQ